MAKTTTLFFSTIALSAWGQFLSAHELTARAIDVNTIELSGTISLANDCISFVGIEASAPPEAPKLLNTTAVVTRLAHNGSQVCTQGYRTVPIELQIPRSERHPANKKSEYVVNYTIIDGAPDGALPFDGLSGEIVAVNE